jgi:myo-inositol-1(or 4)-monophosphatase
VTLDPTALEFRFEVAKGLAREAGAVAKRRFLDRSSFTVGLKGPQDFLTEVDGEVEQLIAKRILKLFPQDGFIGEEGAGRKSAADTAVWVVDPIDGTTNFAHNIPHWCISIAAVVGLEVEVGVIYDAMHDELYAARRGHGATLNAAKIKPSDTAELKRATVEVGWNMRSPRQEFMGLLGRVAAAGSAVTRTGSGTLALAYVATGRRDAYVETFINSWDCLAGLVLVREAGGYVSDFLDEKSLVTGAPIIACAPKIRDELLAVAAIEGLRP